MTDTYAPTGYPLPVADATAQKLANASKQVKVVFDVFAWLILITGALLLVVFVVAAINEYNTYYSDYADYTNETGLYVAAAIGTVFYTAFLWASVKFYSVIAGYVNWRAK